MSTIEIKNSLIQRILTLENVDLLQFLDEILPKTNEIHVLSDFEREMIARGREDVKNGRVSSHEM